MQTARLLTALRAANPQLTPLEVAEALWLACTTGPLAGPAERVDAGADAHAEDEAPDTTPSRPPGDHPRSPAGPERTSVRVPSDPGPSAQLAEGSTVSVPDASALPSSRAIQRALKPLKRRVPTPHRLVLDEEATAQAIAESGTWAPVFRPAAEKWLDLALVVEATSSMAPWETMVDDLQRSLVQLGAFRDVRRWQMHASSRRRGLGVSQEKRPDARADRRPSELTDPGGRRVFFVVTDATSVSWRDGEGGKVLGAWSRHSPVVVLQPLPERLWHRTGLGIRRGTFHSAVPGGATKDMRFVERRRRPRPLRPDEMAVPVVEISPSWLRSWCSMVTGSHGDTTPLAAAVVSLTGDNAGATVPAAAVPEDARALLARFRATASPRAFRLATLLSVVPLDPAVIRLVQRTMLPDSGPTHLAEVILAGILHTDIADAAGFEFRPQMRGLLLDDLRVSEANQIVEAVSAYIQARGGLPGRAFPAVASLPGSARSPVAGDPFAWVPPDALYRLGLADPHPRDPVDPPTDEARVPAPADPLGVLRTRLSFLPTAPRVLVEKMLEEMRIHTVTEAGFQLSLSYPDVDTLRPFLLAVRRGLGEALITAGALITVEDAVTVEDMVRVEADAALSTGQFRVKPLPGPPKTAYPSNGSVLRRFEKRLETLIEGAFAKIFKEVLHPVEILNAICRETEVNGAILAEGLALVPNRFVIDLSPYDHTRLAPYATMLAEELARAEAEFIADQAYTVHGDVIVEIERGDSGLDTGMFRVTAEVYTGAPEAQSRTEIAPRGPALAVGDVPPDETGASFVSRLWRGQRQGNAYDHLDQGLDDLVGGSWSAAVGRAARPADLLRAMWEEADLHKTRLGGKRMRAPDRYLIDLPQADLDRLAPHLSGLAQQLARSIVELISEQRDWTFRGGVVAQIARGSDLRDGSFRVLAEHSRSTVSAEFAPERQTDDGSLLQRFDRRLDAAVGGPADGIFRGTVHPVEILNAMQRESEAHKAVLPGGRPLVPNRYVIDLSTYDHGRLSRFASAVADVLAESQADFIDEFAFVVNGDVSVEIEHDSGLDKGFFRVTAEVHTTPADREDR